MIRLLTFFLLSLLFLVGCASSTDPHEGGFFGGVQGLSSGEYDKRIEERQNRLDRMRQDKEALDRENKQLTKQDEVLQAKVDKEKHRLNKLNKDTNQLRKRIAELEKEGNVTQKEIDRLNKRMKALQHGIDSTNRSLDALEGDNGTPEAIEQRRARLEKQRSTLEKEYQLLLDLSLQLGQ